MLARYIQQNVKSALDITLHALESDLDIITWNLFFFLSIPYLFSKSSSAVVNKIKRQYLNVLQLWRCFLHSYRQFHFHLTSQNSSNRYLIINIFAPQHYRNQVSQVKFFCSICPYKSENLFSTSYRTLESLYFRSQSEHPRSDVLLTRHTYILKQQCTLDLRKINIQLIVFLLFSFTLSYTPLKM